MALQGTLKDFGLADIFQLIGIQRKSGILTLDNDNDSVSVSFLEGQVVAADTKQRNLEDLLGAVLVRTGRISESQLQEALAKQKETLQRLGYILVHCEFVSREELSEALRIQVAQIVYRLFRWRNGRYRFQATEDVEYDREHFTPIGAETILMEGARMIDEWPIIERKIRSDKMIFRKTEAAQACEAPVRSLVEENAGLEFGFTGEGGGGGGEGHEVTLSPDERDVLRTVDGRSSVREIVDRSALGEFDTYRILYDLLNRNLIAEVDRAASDPAAKTLRAAEALPGRLVLVLLLGFAALAVATLGSNPMSPWRVGPQRGSTDDLRGYASRVRLEQVEQAIRVFYLDTGTMPERLTALAHAGYLTPRDLLDPWGRPYRYRLAEGSFQLAGLDARGANSEEFTITRRFNASQRLVLSGSTTGP